LSVSQSQLLAIDDGLLCGSNAFQDYFDDVKESRVKKIPKFQESRFKIQESSFKNQEKTQLR